MDVADTLEFLVGTWELRRAIEDHRLGSSATFVGTASVARSPGDPCGSATYLEVGEVRLGTYRAPARRRLELRARDDGGVTLEFADGRPFVDLDLSTGTWCATHDCGADRYELTTWVRSPATVEERWCVRGPAKRYDAVTTLARLR